MKSMQRNGVFGQLLLCCGMLAANGSSAGTQTLRQIESQAHRWGYLTVSIDTRWKPLSAEEAGQLEQQLQNDPENAEIRANLLNYYWHNRGGAAPCAAVQAGLRMALPH
jgi:hypothetical protein